MSTINVNNYFEIKELLKRVLEIDNEEVRAKTKDLLARLKDEIEKYVKKDDWELDASEIEITIDKNKKGEEKERGKIFIKKTDGSIGYKIGIEHFNPNYAENKDKRDDYIFCGKFYEQNKKGEQWLGKKHITNYKGVEMRVNSMEYVNLLLTEKMDDLVSHFFEEFKTYFNNNK